MAGARTVSRSTRRRNSSAKSLTDLAGPVTAVVPRGRLRVRRELQTPSARKAIEGLEAGDILGFTKGQFSFVDLIDAVLARTGAAAVTVCTWTAAAADASFLGGWAKQGRIRSFRLLIDYSFLNRRGGAEAVDEVLRHFGPDAVRVTRCHAKWALVQGDQVQVAVLTSMNLNANPRFEYFHASQEPAVVALLEGLAAEIWAGPHLADAAKMRPQQHKSDFAAVGRSDDEPASPVDDLDYNLGLEDFEPDLGP